MAGRKIRRSNNVGSMVKKKKMPKRVNFKEIKKQKESKIM